MSNPGTKEVIKEVQAQVQQKLIGEIEQYVPGEDFEDYLERTENYYELNNIKDNVFKKRLIIHSMGAETYTQLKKLMAPLKPTDGTYKYEDVTEKLRSYYCRKKNEIVEHFTFNKRNQQQGESATDYAVELQSLAKKCEFGTFLDKALRDRFVAGLTNSNIQEKLLNKDAKLKFEEAVKEATTYETSKEEVKQFHAIINNGVVNKMTTNARKDTKQSDLYNKKEFVHNYNRVSRENNRDGQYNNNSYNNNYNRNFSNYNRFNRNTQRYDNEKLNNSERYANYICDNCNQRGHIRRFCRVQRGQIKVIDEEEGESEGQTDSVFLRDTKGLNLRESINSINNPIYRTY